MGAVNVTRDEGDSGGLYSWRITFVEPIMSAINSVDEDGSAGDIITVLSFPLLYAGGGEDDTAQGLGTLGAGGEVNVTRRYRVTLGSLSGEVRTGCLWNACHNVQEGGDWNLHTAVIKGRQNNRAVITSFQLLESPLSKGGCSCASMRSAVSRTHGIATDFASVHYIAVERALDGAE